MYNPMPNAHWQATREDRMKAFRHTVIAIALALAATGILSWFGMVPPVNH